ncbi:unnamed protein product [Bursaphelenchus xylophilus]|uniref:One cut domain family member n=1 Tax=Bursaphelenchus xylophilus TaxID=6326 RepID=A0A1I7SF42_BURXY|nr:unnamed protein product [Bursaphelenchus xylophilus]CAG9078854.1 unnamed protein product [Bursaphelenchus xylophilus]
MSLVIMSKVIKSEPDKDDFLQYEEEPIENLMIEIQPWQDSEEFVDVVSPEDDLLYDHQPTIIIYQHESDPISYDAVPPVQSRTAYLHRNRQKRKNSTDEFSDYSTDPPHYSSALPSTSVSSSNSTTSKMLNPYDDDIYIDTTQLAKEITTELKHRCIPQTIFAEKVIDRSQGTLSDLLRNPKPWEELKAGRDTYRRMYSWLNQPLAQRLAMVGMSEGKVQLEVQKKPRPARYVISEAASRRKARASIPKKSRFVFTEIQKRTLHAIFRETQRPSREMQHTIAQHLSLEPATVSNFFMNARRRQKYQPDWARKMGFESEDEVVKIKLDNSDED